MLAPAVTKTGIKVVSTNMLTSDEAQPFLWRGPVLNGILTQFYSDINWGRARLPAHRHASGNR